MTLPGLQRGVQHQVTTFSQRGITLSQNISDEINYAVETASRLMHDEESTRNLAPHCLWELREILSHIDYTDLLPAEVLALLAILCPVHSRVLAGATDVAMNPTGPVLTLVR